jgi:hypothetical protein
LPLESLPALAALRLAGDLRVARREQALWVLAEDPGEELSHALRTLPGGRRFHVLQDNQLLPVGARVPQGYLPKTEWKPLRRVVEIGLPTAGFAGRPAKWVPLRLVRGGPVAVANVLLTDAESWGNYAARAAEIRLQHCRFAMAAEGGVVVWGDPLPPLRGRPFVERDGVAVEAGWQLCPAIDHAVARSVLQLDADDLGLLPGEGPWERIAGSCFVRARRSAIRLSTGGGGS